MTVSTNDSVLFCPQCVSATIDVSSLVGGSASCRACRWQGKKEECLHKNINHQFTSQEEIFRLFSRDVQLLVAEFGAIPIGRMLRKWGFLTDGPDGKPDAMILTRYVRAIARGIASEIVKEREAIEKETAAPAAAMEEKAGRLTLQHDIFPRKVVGRG
jgi:hypothetical protein